MRFPSNCIHTSCLWLLRAADTPSETPYHVPPGKHVYFTNRAPPTCARARAHTHTHTHKGNNTVQYQSYEVPGARQKCPTNQGYLVTYAFMQSMREGVQIIKVRINEIALQSPLSWFQSQIWTTYYTHMHTWNSLRWKCNEDNYTTHVFTWDSLTYRK